MNDSEVKKWWDYDDSSTLDKIKRSITEINWNVLSTKGKRLKSFINKKFKSLPPFLKGTESDWLKEKFLQTCSIYTTPGHGERRQVSLFQVALAPSYPCLSSSSPAVEWRSACRMNRLSCYILFGPSCYNSHTYLSVCGWCQLYVGHSSTCTSHAN